MKSIFKISILLLAIMPVAELRAQLSLKEDTKEELKVVSRSYGPIIGVETGKYTFFEIGAEYHKRRIKFKNPKLYSIGGNFAYNFGTNTAAYKLNFWTKQNRVDLTYGASIVYFTDFDFYRIGVAPTIGFRLFGFHLITGYNLTVGDELDTYNPLFIALRFFIPSENKLKFKKKK
jgi:hypothetical protein